MKHVGQSNAGCKLLFNNRFPQLFTRHSALHLTAMEWEAPAGWMFPMVPGGTDKNEAELESNNTGSRKRRSMSDMGPEAHGSQKADAQSQDPVGDTLSLLLKMTMSSPQRLRMLEACTEYLSTHCRSSLLLNQCKQYGHRCNCIAPMFMGTKPISTDPRKSTHGLRCFTPCVRSSLKNVMRVPLPNSVSTTWSARRTVRRLSATSQGAR